MTFIDMMNMVCSLFIDRFVIVFNNDILVYSRSEEKHEKNLRLMPQNLRDHQFYRKVLEE
jgi:hypothetical protein